MVTVGADMNGKTRVLVCGNADSNMWNECCVNLMRVWVRAKVRARDRARVSARVTFRFSARVTVSHSASSFRILLSAIRMQNLRILSTPEDCKGSATSKKI